MQRPLQVNTVAWSMHTMHTIPLPFISTLQQTLLPLTATGLALASSSGLPVSKISLHIPPPFVFQETSEYIYLTELLIHSINQTSQPELNNSNTGMPRGNENWKRDLSSVSFISPRQLWDLCETKVRLWLISPVSQLFLLQDRCRKSQCSMAIKEQALNSKTFLWVLIVHDKVPTHSKKIHSCPLWWHRLLISHSATLIPCVLASYLAI